MSGWIQSSIGDLTELVTKGTTPSEKDGGFSDSGVNYIKSDAISYEGKIDKSKFVYISQDVHEKFKRSQLKADDILFSMAGAFLGKTGMVFSDMLPANTNQAVAIIRVDKEKAEPKFIHFFLRQNLIVDFVNNMSGQSAQPNINFQEIKSISLDLPSLEEQKSIASVLSSLDDKIDLLHRQNKTLEAMAETLFRQWFVEGVGDWEVVRLGDYFDISSGKGLKKEQFIDGGAFPVLGANGQIGRTDNYLFEEKLLFTGRVGTLGNVFIINGEKVWLSDNTLVFRNIKSFYFVYFVLKDADLAGYNCGSTQPLVRQSDIKEIPVISPPKELLADFEGICLPIFNRINFNKRQIASLEKIRDSLLPKLMSGEMRVS